jgi:hypothetical protein
MVEEEIEPPTVDTQEGSDDDQSVIWTDDSSIVSIPPSDDDGHYDCARGGYVMTIRTTIFPEMTMTPSAQSLT